MRASGRSLFVDFTPVLLTSPYKMFTIVFYEVPRIHS
jgi:hypothetical protein